MLQRTTVHPIASAAGVMPFPRVLIVEDHRLTRETLLNDTRDIGFDAVAASGAIEALRIAAEARPEVIIVDGLLPEMHGFELARLLHNLDADYRPRIILMTAIYKNIRYQNEAKLKYGIKTYVIKPVTKETLRTVLQ